MLWNIPNGTLTMILAGTAVVVTGGAVRIGRHIARELAREGARICLHYGHSSTAADEALSELRELGAEATSVGADLSRPVEAARIVFAHARETLGEIRVLINNAAIFEPGTLASTDEENFDRHIAINLKAPFYLTREFAKQLRPDSHGAVINIVDWRGLRPIPGHAAYTLSKAALAAQTKLLAQELGPRIRVNGIAPGAILPAPGSSLQAFADRAKWNPLHRTGTPDDVARAVNYLLTSEFVTGEILHVTGGEELGTKPSSF
jgi:NAD(P)-dependent dehydrogenase (short-subunit alcohol dehydrogenase family)